MLAAWASCANEYAKEKEKKKMIFSIKCHKALLKYKRDYLLNNMLYNNIPKVVYITRLFFSKVSLKVGFR